MSVDCLQAYLYTRLIETFQNQKDLYVW